MKVLRVVLVIATLLPTCSAAQEPAHPRMTYSTQKDGGPLIPFGVSSIPCSSNVPAAIDCTGGSSTSLLFPTYTLSTFCIGPASGAAALCTVRAPNATDFANWGLSAGSVATDPIFDAKGDLPAGTGANTAARLPVGTNGFVLTADSAETTGLKWAAGGGVTDGDKGDITVSGSGATWDVDAYNYSFTLHPEEAQFKSTGSAQLIVNQGTNFPVSALAFDGTTSECAFWKADAIGYVSGNVVDRVYWYPASGTTNAVVFEAAIAAITPNTDTGATEAKAFATANTASDSNLGATAGRLHSFDITSTNTDSLAADDIFWFRLCRLPADAGDTMTAIDAIVPAVRLTYLRSF